MKNIENVIVEFVKHIDVVDYICISLGLLLFFLPIYAIIVAIRKEKDKKEKKHNKIFLVFYLCFYVGLISLLVRNQIEKKNTSIESLNNKYNIFVQENNNNIELYYVQKNEEVIKEIDSIKKSQFKIVIEKTKDEKYYISFHKPTDAFDILKFKEDRRKEVKKEDLKEFINNIKQQDNYKGTGKHEKLTLEDFK